MVAAVQAVLEEYHDYLPMTLRQIFYRLVTQGAVEKTERGYSQLCEHMNRARRAGFIPMESIRDDGTTVRMAHDFDTEQEVRSYLHEIAGHARMDLQRGQDRRLEIWCEAAGMVPQLERVAHPFGVPIISSGGFDSLTAKHDMARRYAEQGNTLVLHIGDYDPSGVHIFSSLAEDITAFLEGLDVSVPFARLAVLPEQIELYQLPTAIPKKTDKRSFNDNRTVQAEAFDPVTLAQLVKYAIIQHLDMQAYFDACQWRDGVQERLASEVRV
jgi:hypothetical protein